MELASTIWLDIGEEVEFINLVSQLMMLKRDPFLQLQDEDNVITNILQNQYGSNPNSLCCSSNNCSLQVLSPDCQWPSPIAKELYHQFLPHEIQEPSFTDASMIELTNKIELSPGHCLNINRKLTTQQQTTLTKILEAHTRAFAWDYYDMKGLDPKLWTHRIYLKEDKPLVMQFQR